MKKTLATHNKVMDKARVGLLEGFDTAAKNVRKRKANALEKTHLFEVVEAEKARFEGTGEPPWSGPMRNDFTRYLTATPQSRALLQRVVESEVSKLLKAGDSESAKALSNEFEADISPQPVGRWVASAVGYPDVTITMSSNGKFTDRDGKPNCEWAYNNGILLMRWPSSFGGFADAKVQVSDDGLSYRGQDKAGVINTGKFVAAP